MTEIEGMLQPGRMPLNEAENAAIDALIEEHGGEAVKSFTRTQPGETGPIWVTVDEDEYEVTEDGTVTKL